MVSFIFFLSCYLSIKNLLLELSLILAFDLCVIPKGVYVLAIFSLPRMKTVFRLLSKKNLEQKKGMRSEFLRCLLHPYSF
jgi:hypothetical protein